MFFVGLLFDIKLNGSRRLVVAELNSFVRIKILFSRWNWPFSECWTFDWSIEGCNHFSVDIRRVRVSNCCSLRFGCKVLFWRWRILLSNVSVSCRVVVWREERTIGVEPSKKMRISLKLFQVFVVDDLLKTCYLIRLGDQFCSQTWQFSSRRLGWFVPVHSNRFFQMFVVLVETTFKFVTLFYRFFRQGSRFQEIRLKFLNRSL